jgi:hypothetical protein
MQCTVRNAQVAGDLGQWFLTRLGKLHCFYLELSGKGSLGLWHDLFPFCEGLLFKFTFPTFSGQDHLSLSDQSFLQGSSSTLP